MTNQSNHDPNSFKSYQIVNNFPEKQALVLNNTNPREPIQLRVDPITDYTALGFTLVVSIIVSAVTGFVTIWLITKSNDKLSRNQNKLQDQMLTQQSELKKNEIKAQNRQEWINRVRDLFIDYLSAINHSYIELQKYINTEIQINNKISMFKDPNAHSEKFKTFDYKFRSYVISADLLLSKSDKLDRNIVDNMNKILNNYDQILYNLQMQAIQSNSKEIDSSYFSNSNPAKEMDRLKGLILNNIKDLLKTEWERVKKFE